MPFRGVDYFSVDSLFSEEELMVRQTARRFADERVAPLIRDCFRDARFPAELIPEMAELGFLGANLEGYGCAGMSNVEYGLVMQELERVDSGLRSFVSVQGALVMYPILTYGSEEQKQKWLPRLQSGKAIGCFGLTEPDFGSNPAGHADHRPPRRRRLGAERREDVDHQRLGGRCRGGLGARRRWRVVRFPGGARNAGLHHLRHPRQMVDAGVGDVEPGVCRLPRERADRLPGAKGLKGPLSCLTQARFGIGWGVIGAAMDCYETARQYSILRKQFDDRPIASHQLVQEKLAWMITEITKAQLLAVQAGRLKDRGKLEPAHISMLKRNNVAMALECARLSRDLLGANGITDEYPIMRHLCNLETVKTYEGTDHIHALVIGERVTGIAAYK